MGGRRFLRRAFGRVPALAGGARASLCGDDLEDECGAVSGAANPLVGRLAAPEGPGWVCLALSEICAAGMARWLLVRRDPDDPDAEAYWLAYGPEGTSEAALVRVCEARWQIEECFAQTKGEVGMDQYEVRTWMAWHRFVTLCLVAHASLVAMRHAAQREEAEKKGVPTPA